LDGRMALSSLLEPLQECSSLDPLEFFAWPSTGVFFTWPSGVFYARPSTGVFFTWPSGVFYARPSTEVFFTWPSRVLTIYWSLLHLTLSGVVLARTFYWSLLIWVSLSLSYFLVWVCCVSCLCPDTQTDDKAE
jgi:hypothetical protein